MAVLKRAKETSGDGEAKMLLVMCPSRVDICPLVMSNQVECFNGDPGSRKNRHRKPDFPGKLDRSGGEQKSVRMIDGP